VLPSQRRQRRAHRGSWATVMVGCWAGPKGIVTFLIYSNNFRFDLNLFDQKVAFCFSKISNKIWVVRELNKE
jgi:hypothetical protein